LPNILKSIKPVLSDLVKEVERSLGYFTSTHRDAHIAYMVGVGNAFKLPRPAKVPQRKALAGSPQADADQSPHRR
jgi:Tfp pilus assembly PilM family ATPase